MYNYLNEVENIFKYKLKVRYTIIFNTNYISISHIYELLSRWNWNDWMTLLQLLDASIFQPKLHKIIITSAIFHVCFWNTNMVIGLLIATLDHKYLQKLKTWWVEHGEIQTTVKMEYKYAPVGKCVHIVALFHHRTPFDITMNVCPFTCRKWGLFAQFLL